MTPSFALQTVAQIELTENDRVRVDWRACALIHAFSIALNFALRLAGFSAASAGVGRKGFL